MLNQYLPIDMLKQELLKRDYLFQRVNHDEGWKGGALQVPFEQQHGSSVEMGQLADITDISQYAYGRGSITTQPEAWASLLFLHKDLVQHDGKIPETTFLRILPNQVDAMLSYLKMVISVQLLGHGQLATFTANGNSSGQIVVDRIDRFTLSQKVTLNDNGTVGPGTYYVIGIIIDTLTITVSASRGGSAANVSTYTTANGAVVQSPGQATGSMTSLGSQLLSAANGGSTNLFGLAKTSAPFLQCPNFSGAAITASNILIQIFDAYTNRMQLAKSGKLPEVVMSFKNFGSCLKLLDIQKGPFNVVPGSRKVSAFGWDTIEIGSVAGHVLKLVGIQECPDDLIYFFDLV